MLRLVGRQGNNRMRHVCLKGGIELNYRLNRSDLWIIHEVWVKEIYRSPVEAKSGIIVDLGANVGLASLWLAKRHRCTRLIGAEPASDNVRVARANMSRNEIPGAIEEVAIGSKDCQGVFLIGPCTTSGRVDFAAKPTEVSQPTGASRAVPVWSMARLLQSIGPAEEIDVMKVDIEGGEQELLQGDLEWLARVRCLICEFHPQLVDYPRLQQVLADAGFFRLRMTSVNGDTVECFRRGDVALSQCA
jgi:FkbM family methyltransferase